MFRGISWSNAPEVGGIGLGDSSRSGHSSRSARDAVVGRGLRKSCLEDGSPVSPRLGQLEFSATECPATFRGLTKPAKCSAFLIGTPVPSLAQNDRRSGPDGLVQASLGLTKRPSFEIVLVLDADAAGINQLEVPVVMAHQVVDPISGDSRSVFDDRYFAVLSEASPSRAATDFSRIKTSFRRNGPGVKGAS